MAFYWSLKSVPELAAMPSWVGEAIVTQCATQYKRPHRWAFAFGSLALFLVLVASLAIGFVFRTHPTVAGIVEVGLLSAISLHFRIASAVPCIRRWVGGVCPSCGYDLRAAEGRCSECGSPVDLGLGSHQKVLLLSAELEAYAHRKVSPSRVELMFFPLPAVRVEDLKQIIQARAIDAVVSETSPSETWLKSTHLLLPPQEWNEFFNWICATTYIPGCRLAAFRVVF